MGDRSIWLLRRMITLAWSLVAMFALVRLWTHSELAPWTRDSVCELTVSICYLVS